MMKKTTRNDKDEIKEKRESLLPPLAILSLSQGAFELGIS